MAEKKLKISQYGIARGGSASGAEIRCVISGAVYAKDAASIKIKGDNLNLKGLSRLKGQGLSRLSTNIDNIKDKFTLFARGSGSLTAC